MGVRKRIKQANYLKVNGVWEFLGFTMTSLSEKPSPKTTSKRYVGNASATQGIGNYEWSTDFEGDQIESDKATEYIVNIGEMCLTGSDAESEYLIVDVDKPGTVEDTFRCRKFGVAIQVDELPDNDGELGLKGGFLGTTDPEEGTFTKNTKDYVKGFNAKTLEFAYVSTGAITEISIVGVTYDDTNDKFIGIPANTTTFTFKDVTVLKTATLGSTWSVA